MCVVPWVYAFLLILSVRAGSIFDVVILFSFLNIGESREYFSSPLSFSCYPGDKKSPQCVFYVAPCLLHLPPFPVTAISSNVRIIGLSSGARLCQTCGYSCVVYGVTGRILFGMM